MNTRTQNAGFPTEQADRLNASPRLMPSTARRLENMRLLLAELSRRPMQIDDIAALLGASVSAARNYVLELCDAGVANAVDGWDGKSGKPHYRLAADPARSRAFLEQMTNPYRDAGVVVRRVTAGKPAKVAMGSGRNVHITGDDVHYAFRVEREPVRRDPLVAALFGAARELA